MRKEFEMSMFEEIKFFVGLQVYQMKKGIYIIQSKYIKDILKTYGMEDSRPVGTPMATRITLVANIHQLANLTHRGPQIWPILLHFWGVHVASTLPKLGPMLRLITNNNPKLFIFQ